MSRHELPSGGCVYLRDDRMLRAKDQKRIMRGARAATNGSSNGQPDILEVGLSVTDGVIAALVEDWKLPYDPDPAGDGTPRQWVLPSADPTIVDELSMGDYNKLCELVADAQKAAFPSKPDPTDYEDPLSPTGPANA